MRLLILVCGLICLSACSETPNRFDPNIGHWAELQCQDQGGVKPNSTYAGDTWNDANSRIYVIRTRCRSGLENKARVTISNTTGELNVIP